MSNRMWMLILVWAGTVVTAASGPGPNPFEGPADWTPANRIDELVFGRLRQLGLEPARLCSDPVFVRRAYLDVIGTLPSGWEAEQFILDRAPDKRRKLIDRLLARDEFADYWAMKWSDRLRVKSEFPINLWPNAVQAYHRWIRTSLRENKPYTQFARELLTSSGSNFRVPPVNFYRAVQSKDPTGLARAVALTFMGVRLEHWPPEQVAALAEFFAQVGFKPTGEWKEEIVFFDPASTNAKPALGSIRTGVLPDGQQVQWPADKDPRLVFADWLIRAENPWFTRNIANRIWAWLLGRGIIHEPDDIRPDNPPSHPELLAWLEEALIRANYDLKQLYRLILNSKTYQLSSIPRSRGPAAAAHFAYYPLRRLEAEVLIDALNQITGTTEKYSSPIPEPFTFIPEAHRAIALADGSITSPFLEMFGRPPRDTGLESERSNRPSVAQRLHLLNSSHILRKLEQSRLIRFLTQENKTLRDMVRSIYLAILSRYPTQDELEAVVAYAQSSPAQGPEVAVDLAWALINSAEFLYRH